ncbi:unnamed protein product [Pleuronectes platessa]|uniref:Uncharacterized protein n=1 Tax=Pleuronectes platessa TaxID=8262 RepID=A0A9N7Z4D4_PLEPL|nr:unnamed protein product [Pleuronectes platessa]
MKETQMWIKTHKWHRKASTEKSRLEHVQQSALGGKNLWMDARMGARSAAQRSGTVVTALILSLPPTVV